MHSVRLGALVCVLLMLPLSCAGKTKRKRRTEPTAISEVVAAVASTDSVALLRLLRHGADPNTVIKGASIIFTAASLEWQYGVQLLLQSGADPNFVD